MVQWRTGRAGNEEDRSILYVCSLKKKKKKKKKATAAFPLELSFPRRRVGSGCALFFFVLFCFLFVFLVVKDSFLLFFLGQKKNTLKVEMMPHAFHS